MMDDFYGDRFRWFVGVVKDIGDDRSRVRVRIFGIHHTEDVTKVSDGDLPWALVLYPTTGGQASSGNASHNLTSGSWVVGFFMDGIDSQQPIVIGSINGGAESTNSSPAENTGTNPSNNNGTGGQTNNGSGTALLAVGTNDSSQLTGGTNVQKVYNFFWQKLTQEGAYSGDLKCIVSAIVGNLQGESGQNIDPQSYNANDKGAPSAGIAQWRNGKGGRMIPFLRFCGINTLVGKGNLPPLEKQLDYMWHELHTSEKSAFNKLIVSTTIQDAVAGMIYFERDDSYQKINGVWMVNRNGKSYQNKLRYARNILSSMSYTGSPSSK